MAVEAPVARVVLLGRTSPVLARGGVGTSSRRSDRPATDAAGGAAGEQVGARDAGLPCTGRAVLDGDLGLVVLPLGLGRWEECRIVGVDEDAAQGGGVPAEALARPESLAVEVAGDLTERCLGQELAEDALDDGGFVI